MNALQQENYFLKSALESATFTLNNVNQLMAVIHNHELETPELEAMLWTIWTQIEQAINDTKDITGGEL